MTWESVLLVIWSQCRTLTFLNSAIYMVISIIVINTFILAPHMWRTQCVFLSENIPP